jgi:heptosyltransferase-1
MNCSENDNLPVERLLAVNLNYLGDALFTTPALSALRTRFPNARIDVLAGTRAAAILSGHPAVDRLILRPPHGGLGRAATLSRTLREGRYDMAVLFQSTLSNAALAWTAGVPRRIGFSQEGSAPLLTGVVAPCRPGEHVVDAYNRLAQAATGEPVTAPRLSIAVTPAEEEFVEALLRDREVAPPVVGLVIGATRPQKRWPEDYWVRLADRLWHSAGVCSVLLGGPEETEAAQRILSEARSPLVSVVGQTTEKELAALVARLGVVVSGDSGPLHIATAMATPVVALFGSTDPGETGPWQPPLGPVAPTTVLYDAFACAPCRKEPICEGRFDCLRALTPERVYTAVCDLLGVPSHHAVLPMVPATTTIASAPTGLIGGER